MLSYDNDSYISLERISADGYNINKRLELYSNGIIKYNPESISTTYNLQLPSKSGTIALLEDITGGSNTCVHNIYITQDISNSDTHHRLTAAMMVINDSEEPITTLDQLKLYVKGSNKSNMCSGYIYMISSQSKYYPIIGIKSYNNNLSVVYINTSSNSVDSRQLTTDAIIEDLNYPSTT